MPVVMPKPHSTSQSNAEIRGLDDLRVLRELEGAFDPNDSADARPLLSDLVRYATQIIAKLSSSRGNCGYP